MKQLKDILKKFSDNRTEYLNSHSWATMPEDDRVNAVKEWAEPVAKKIINEGFCSNIREAGFGWIEYQTKAG